MPVVVDTGISGFVVEQTPSDFNADEFRTAITFAMNMGIPNDVNEAATFRWTTKTAYDIEDPNDRPYHWTETPVTAISHPDAYIPVAVEFISTSTRGTVDTSIAHMDTARVILTVLDNDYSKVNTADLVILGGNTYIIDFVEPPIGLFEVTIYRIHCTARDES